MRKGICIFILLIICGAVSLYGKRFSELIFQKPVNKTVCFLVYAGTDYSASLYKKSKAKVILSIYKYGSNNKELIWEGVIDEGSLNNYSACSQLLYREVCIYNVREYKETLAAYYKVVYNMKGSKFSYENGVRLSAGSKSDSLQVLI